MLGCFGHAIFIAMHVLAILFGVVGLIITIPLHLIFAALLTRRK